MAVREDSGCADNLDDDDLTLAEGQVDGWPR